MIRWDVPGPYEVVFSTREGGVSEGPYASLNLGRMTGDDVERVDENRRRLCVEIGADVERLALNRQMHSPHVHRAEAGGRGRPGDGLWTDEPGLPVLAMSADCLPIALVRADGRRRPSPSCTRAGAGCSTASSSGRPRRWAGGPGGDRPGDRAVLLRGGRRGRGALRGRLRRRVIHGRNLDLWGAAERALSGRASRTSIAVDLCTHCNPERFFSHRRTGKPRGVQGVIARVA